MKGCIFQANIEVQGPGGWDIFEKKGKTEKGCIEIEDWDFSMHFVLGFQENSIYILHLCLTKIF